MAEEQLVFNGINGATGEYGLRPLTGRQLAEHILAESTDLEKEHQTLTRSVSQRSRDAAIVAIVRLLAESNEEDVIRDKTWHARWVHKLATSLADELLGDSFAGRPEKLRDLENRLSLDASAKIQAVVRLLLDNKLQELADLLLIDQDEAPDIGRELEVRLRRFAEEQFRTVEDHSLAADRSDHLEGNENAQRQWLQELITGLHLVPVAALNAKVSIRFVTPLLLELDKLSASFPTAGNWLASLRQTLASEPHLAWPNFLQHLQDALVARIDDPDEHTPWSDLLAHLRSWLRAVRRPLATLGVIEGVDRTNLAEAGWGVIFPVVDQALPVPIAEIRQALEPLLNLRRSQAGQFYREYVLPNEPSDGSQRAGFRPNDTAGRFLARQGAMLANPADPKKVPYYLLIVGSPEAIPFHFQYQLDVQYAVGRIDFGDDLDAYASYAHSVVACEQEIRLAPQAAFFGAANPLDQMTALTAQHLIGPLHTRLSKRYGDRWRFDKIVGEEAQRERLLRLLGGEETPALLFTACHGMEFPKDDTQGRQVAQQGALLCQDWEGPEAGLTAIPRSYYLAGEDLTEQTNLLGLIAFFFACYSAGTPRFDEYSKQAFKETGATITDVPFVAALPKAMLSLPKGAALAVVGHVERAWGTSFLGQRESQQIAVFESAIEHLLNGHPVGSAMEYFNGRYAALSTELTVALDEASFGIGADDYELAYLWTANNDARGYIVIGDPAVRLPTGNSVDVATGRRDLDR